ncbi:transposase [Paracoccus sp. pheM1]|nr:transposase [Paracoccus sp. pheM1]
MPGARVSDVARRHAVTRWQIYDWRKKLASGQLALTAETASEPMFAALVVAPPSAPVTGPRDGSVRSEAKKTIGIPASQPLEQELSPREIRRGGHVRRS